MEWHEVMSSTGPIELIRFKCLSVNYRRALRRIEGQLWSDQFGMPYSCKGSVFDDDDYAEQFSELYRLQTLDSTGRSNRLLFGVRGDQPLRSQFAL